MTPKNPPSPTVVRIVRQGILYQQAGPLTSGQGTSEAGEEIAYDIEDTGEQNAKSGCDDDEVGIETGQELSEQGLDDCNGSSSAALQRNTAYRETYAECFARIQSTARGRCRWTGSGRPLPG